MRSDITADHDLREKDLRKRDLREKDLREKDLHHGEETTGDFTFDRVPREERKMGWVSITNITFGIATAIFYFQMGSVMALQFGAANAIISAGIRHYRRRHPWKHHRLFVGKIRHERQLIIPRRIRLHRGLVNLINLRIEFYHVLCI